MPFRLLLALLLLVAAPLALLGWVTSTSMRQQNELARDQLQSVLRSRLVEIDRNLSAVLDEHDRRVTEQIDRPVNTIAQLRSLELTDPVVRQGIYVDGRGIMIYPVEPGSGSSDKRSLYASLPAMVDGRPQGFSNELNDAVRQVELTRSRRRSGDAANQQRLGPVKGRGPANDLVQRDAGPLSSGPLSSGPLGSGPLSSGPLASGQNVPGQALQQQAFPIQTAQQPSELMTNSIGKSRWQVWYLDEGSQLVLWVPLATGADVGVMLERARWISDLTAVLPETISPIGEVDSGSHGPLKTSSRPTQTPGFTALVDESKQIIYRWGDEGECTDSPLASIPLSAPLSSWRLEYHADEMLLPEANATSLYASLAGLAAALVGLGGYVLTSVQRQMKTARSRVTFAGQVSHELRTPLTNIQLYAELAESDLDSLPENETRAKLAGRLDVIDVESRRLGRLVSGVLEMIRDDRKQRGPKIVSAIPDEWIDRTIHQFAPSFEKNGIEVVRVAGADRQVDFDPDILEMVLINLLSNVEKYAAAGKYVKVLSELNAKELVVQVSDRGPGIASRHHRRVFRPFSRLDDSISAPSGTGIGLTIARRAATRHGGSLRLIACPDGSCFELRIPVK